jgi:hypothetical protein
VEVKPYTTVVVSTAGHDKGGIFAVVGFAGEGFLLLADGKLRKLEKPKKKKRKHVKAIGELKPMSPVLTNRQLSRALKPFRTENLPVTEGGITLVQG